MSVTRKDVYNRSGVDSLEFLDGCGIEDVIGGGLDDGQGVPGSGLFSITGFNSRRRYLVRLLARQRPNQPPKDLSR